MVKDKLKKIQTFLRDSKLDGLVAGNFGHQIQDDLLYYLLLKHLEVALLYIPAAGRPTLWAISFEVDDVRRSYPEFNVRAYNGLMHELLGSVVTKKAMIGIRQSAMPLNQHRHFKRLTHVRTVPLFGEEKIFAQKIPQEIRLMKRACAITDRVFHELVQNWRSLTTEADAAKFLHIRMAEHGVEPSFPPIIASGAHAADPHYGSGKTKIRKGFCVIDMGVRYKGYCSDMTRTVYVGKPNKAERKLYETVLEVQQLGVSMVCGGAAAADIDRACRQALGELDKQFIHSLGHGLGTQVHEWPRVSIGSDTVLAEGMVITIEPGVYAPGLYGIRIEDDVLVGVNGQTVLSKASRELILL